MQECDGKWRQRFAKLRQLVADHDSISDDASQSLLAGLRSVSPLQPHTQHAWQQSAAANAQQSNGDVYGHAVHEDARSSAACTASLAELLEQAESELVLESTERTESSTAQILPPHLPQPQLQRAAGACAPAQSAADGTQQQQPQQRQQQQQNDGAAKAGSEAKDGQTSEARSVAVTPASSVSLTAVQDLLAAAEGDQHLLHEQHTTSEQSTALGALLASALSLLIAVSRDAQFDTSGVV